MSSLFALFLAVCFVHTMTAQSLDVLYQHSNTPYRYLKIAFDAKGNAYHLISFKDTIDVDPSAEEHWLYAKEGYDVCLSKFDASGQWVWSKTLQSTKDIFGTCLAIGEDGHLYLAGEFYGAVDFDAGKRGVSRTAVPQKSTHYSGHTFICQYDTNGNFQWVHDFGNGSLVRPSKLLASKASGVYLMGHFEGQLQLHPDQQAPLAAVADSLFRLDVYVMKLAADGHLKWVRAFYSPHETTGRDLAIEPSSKALYLLTNWRHRPYGSMTVNGQWNERAFGHYWGDSTCLTKVNATTGASIWQRFFKAPSIVNLRELAIGLDQKIYVAGQSSQLDSTMLDVEEDTRFLYTNSIKTKGVLLQLDTAGHEQWRYSTQGRGPSYFLQLAIGPQGLVYALGATKDSLDLYFQGDTLTFPQQSNYDHFLQVFQPTGVGHWGMFFSGKRYRSLQMNGFRAQHLALVGYSKSAGQVSPEVKYPQDLFFAQLSMLPLAPEAVYDTVCQTYFAPTGRQSWTHSGDYLIAFGDSLKLVHLTVYPYPDTTVFVSGNTLVSKAVNGHYQWLDAAQHNRPVEGATEERFTPPQEGQYALSVTQHGCTDTSAVHSFVGVDQTAFDQAVPPFTLSPNPAPRYAFFQLAHPATTPLEVVVKRPDGTVHSTHPLPAGEKRLELYIDGDIEGVYTVHLVSVHYTRAKRLIVE